MKKVTLFAVAAIAALSLSSCAKEHTCTCTETDSSGSDSYTITYTKAHKKAAREDCEMHAIQVNQTAPVSTTGSKTTCTFK